MKPAIKETHDINHGLSSCVHTCPVATAPPQRKQVLHTASLTIPKSSYFVVPLPLSPPKNKEDVDVASLNLKARMMHFDCVNDRRNRNQWKKIEHYHFFFEEARVLHDWIFQVENACVAKKLLSLISFKSWRLGFAALWCMGRWLLIVNDLFWKHDYIFCTLNNMSNSQSLIRQGSIKWT